MLERNNIFGVIGLVGTVSLMENANTLDTNVLEWHRRQTNTIGCVAIGEEVPCR